MKRPALLLFSACLAVAFQARAQMTYPSPDHTAARLPANVSVQRDQFGVAHITAQNDHDLYFAQGYVHAQDRLFQMDVTRRQASGTLAELFGAAALKMDGEMRTIGIRRAAERSILVVSNESRAALEAYARGVNAYVASAPLPPEYTPLEIRTFRPWTALDSMTVAKALAFSLSFDLRDIDHTNALAAYSDPLRGWGPTRGALLFSEDLWRSQPFTAASTLPDASVAAPLAGAAGAQALAPGSGFRFEARDHLDPRLQDLAKSYGDRVRDLPFFNERMNMDRRRGSNEWAIAGRNTATGKPMVANDPHLPLTNPSTLYPIHLKAQDMDVFGSSFAGTPGVALGETLDVAWGATVSPLDVTDVYFETVVDHGGGRYGTIYKGVEEPVVVIPEKFRMNVIGDGTFDNLVDAPPGSVPAATLIVPRRNNGPIVQLGPSTLGIRRGLSVQYTGFSGTRELDAFRIFNRAHNLNEFKNGLQFFATGTENFAYADRAGNIAYFAASEVPLREDLQNNTVVFLPPWFIRSGAGGNEWLPVRTPRPGQQSPYAILPLNEMPSLVNPPAGWFVNANNDPDGTVLDNNPLNRLRPGGGIYYLNPGYDLGLRAQRITDIIRARLRSGPLSFADMQSIQADVMLPDAPFFAPFIVRALQRAQFSSNPLLTFLAADPGVQTAVSRIANWRYTAPTGIREGYDASDVNGVRTTPPSANEISESIAATIYTVWRGQFLLSTIDQTLGTRPKPGDQLSLTALKTLLLRPQPGVGASGVNFFNISGVASAEDRRDIFILASLTWALQRLAGPYFNAAFGSSPNQDNYRWGKLHRLVLNHPLGGPFNAPPAFGAFPNPLGDALPGFPVDGGFASVDVGNFPLRAWGANDFLFNAGPSNRFVAIAETQGMRAESSWPGGTSAIPGNQFYLNLLPGWLTNDTIPLLRVINATRVAGAGR